MKRLLILFLLLALPVVAEMGYTEVSAIETAQSVTIAARSVLIVNDGSNEIYFRLFRVGDTTGDATTASAQLKSGESINFASDSNSYSSLSIICASGETATVRVYAE